MRIRKRFRNRKRDAMIAEAEKAYAFTDRRNARLEEHAYTKPRTLPNTVFGWDKVCEGGEVYWAKARPPHRVKYRVYSDNKIEASKYRHAHPVTEGDLDRYIQYLSEIQ